MGKPKKKSSKDLSEKYIHQNKLAAVRAQKCRDKMTDEQKEEYRKKARERYRRRKAEKKVKMINELSSKEQNEKRKQWKKDSKKYRAKKKMQEKATENTPPQSEEEVTEPRQLSRQKIIGRKIVRREKAKVYREIKKKDEKLKKKDDKIKELERKLAKYKKKCQRLDKKSNKTLDDSTQASPSPSKRVNELVGQQRVSTPVKKQLFIGFALEKQLKNQVKNLSPKMKESQVVRKVIGSKILRKYRVQNQLKHIVPYKFNKHQTDFNINYDRKIYNTVKVKDAKLIQRFFEDDLVSKMCPGKKDEVKRGKLRKQRRILLDSMKNLYNKFVMEHGQKVSYTTFTRVRPFWVQPPNARDRETCACVVHENMQLLVNALKNANVIKFSNLNDMLASLVCSTDQEQCMNGSCNMCKNKKVDFNINEHFEMKFEQWVTDLENKIIKGKEKKIRRTVKRERVEPISIVHRLFLTSLKVFKKHVFNLKHQAMTFSSLKTNLREGQLIFQVDFSQNYIAKYATEIQATHFGASKRQVSLHTGLRYHWDGEKTAAVTFCTLSDNLDHHAHAVWEHLKPVLEESASSFPDTHTIHIFSDSPSSQYRNRANVYLMKLLLPTIFNNLKSFTWNFSEPGHGKGAMDGVGGSLKRSADLMVKHGRDITCAGDLVAALGSKSKTRLIEIPNEAIESAKKALPRSIPPVMGIMSLRQITCSTSGDMFGRRLSCFKCEVDKKCDHYGLIKISGLGSETEKVPHKTGYIKPKKPLSSLLDKCPDTSSEDDEIQLLRPKRGNEIKSYKEIFTSSEDEEPEVFVPEPRNEPQSSGSGTGSIMKTNNVEGIQLGDFLLIRFEPNKKKGLCHQFVGVCQGSKGNEGEIEVMFLKTVSTKDKTLFLIDEKDISNVDANQVVAVLPTPSLMVKGDRIYYKFKCPIHVF